MLARCTLLKRSKLGEEKMCPLLYGVRQSKACNKCRGRHNLPLIAPSCGDAFQANYCGLLRAITTLLFQQLSKNIHKQEGIISSVRAVQTLSQEYRRICPSNLILSVICSDIIINPCRMAVYTGNPDDRVPVDPYAPDVTPSQMARLNSAEKQKVADLSQKLKV